jgi:DNA-binding CsgD family transcriptional regulator
MPVELANTGKGSLASDPVSTLKDLVKLLLGQVAVTENRTPRHENDPKEGEEEIILDVELEDARYLLVRMPRARFRRVQLSPREQEIARMVAQGHPNKVIAEVLNISGWTVCTYLRRIFAKLGVGSRAAMVARLHESSVIGGEKKLFVPRPEPVRAGCRNTAAAS